MTHMHYCHGKHLILALTGGIAVYKSAELVRRGREAGLNIDVVMTRAAQKFVQPITFQALSGRRVLTDLWDPQIPDSMAHIHLSRQADALLVAPASADFIARAAQGRADDLLTTMALARGQCPMLIAPAMNKEMWAHPATQRNIAQLKQDGVTILGPAAGEQACGEVGTGRMLEPHELLAELNSFFAPKPLHGKRVVITAGPTSEAIDPIRVITNRSSGKMGYAIAQAAQLAGAKVILISGPVALPSPYRVQRINVHSAREMYHAVMQHAPAADIFISVAAVADWYIKNAATHKLKKGHQFDFGTLQFAENPDILASVAALPNPPYCVGFAAETEQLLEFAQQKRQRKGVPLLVANLAQETMDADHTVMHLIDDQGIERWDKLPKEQAATDLIQAIAQRLGAAPQPPIL